MSQLLDLFWATHPSKKFWGISTDYLKTAQGNPMIKVTITKAGRVVVSAHYEYSSGIAAQEAEDAAIARAISMLPDSTRE